MKFSMRKHRYAVALVAALVAAGSPAQQVSPGTGAVVAVSQPGAAGVATQVKVSAQVVGIDRATRTLTLKGPKGQVVDLVASDEIKNFDQIKVGDKVVANYVEALTLELRKTKVAAGDVTVSEQAGRAATGQRPAVAGARQVTLIAEVVALDPKASTISLKGPKGNVETIDVRNPDQFKVVKKGDQVEVTYTQAIALSVEPAPASAKK